MGTVEIKGIDILNANKKNVGILVTVRNDSITIEDIISDSELEYSEDVRDKAFSKWDSYDDVKEIEDEEIDIFVENRVGGNSKELDYWYNYEADEAFELLEQKIKESILNTKILKEEEERKYKQMNLFE
ncbi:hypothetical protein [Nostoc sp. UHCC 0870]|uniref:hypothetical protein n=1 Tax=Nostoc sp. UHCC 0870 TaxID=2914041 RepID=UPI001EE11E3B|nr:hypothetical protein [Nostoc sp. UHCC 0870]UKP01576.1 hypothetical protein L6494_30585 [Nostoc sp. UHCC 0870]